MGWGFAKAERRGTSALPPPPLWIRQWGRCLIFHGRERGTSYLWVHHWRLLTNFEFFIEPHFCRKLRSNKSSRRQTIPASLLSWKRKLATMRHLLSNRRAIIESTISLDFSEPRPEMLLGGSFRDPVSKRMIENGKIKLCLHGSLSVHDFELISLVSKQCSSLLVIIYKYIPRRNIIYCTSTEANRKFSTFL